MVFLALFILTSCKNQETENPTPTIQENNYQILPESYKRFPEMEIYGQLTDVQLEVMAGTEDEPVEIMTIEFHSTLENCEKVDAYRYIELRGFEMKDALKNGALIKGENYALRLGKLNKPGKIAGTNLFWSLSPYGIKKESQVCKKTYTDNVGVYENTQVLTGKTSDGRNINDIKLKIGEEGIFTTTMFSKLQKEPVTFNVDSLHVERDFSPEGPEEACSATPEHAQYTFEEAYGIDAVSTIDIIFTVKCQKPVNCFKEGDTYCPLFVTGSLSFVGKDGKTYTFPQQEFQLRRFNLEE